ncbi:hypothetical protein JTB14_009447 [Gonioctena quinquepunctata]|nr:hypothetical protein JTB14_009447 [Gonioctena quinquepunctata]
MLEEHLLKCRFRRSCEITNYRRPHNKYLHKEDPKNSTTNEQRLIEEYIPPQSHSTESYQIVLATSRGKTNVKLHSPRNTIFDTVALCDDASTVTLIDQWIVEKLKLKRTVEPLQWTNDVAETKNVRSVEKLHPIKTSDLKTGKNIPI